MISPDVRAEVVGRSEGRCELCNGPLRPMSVHHRRPRGMGGTRRAWVNEAANLLVVCGTGTTGCHGMIESRRADAYESGWLIRSGMDPTEVPYVDLAGEWRLLPDKNRITFPFTR